MQNCGNCKYFRPRPVFVGWAPSEAQGVCAAPIPEGYSGCQVKLMSVDKGEKCPTWETESK